MNVIIVKDKIEGGKKAFELVKETVESGAKVLGFATGSTPETLYEEMVNSDLDFSKILALNLDEYVGLDKNHPQSYHAFMEDHLFSKKTFKETHIPNGMADENETDRYEEIVEKNPIDLQILGIGTNGHIGFNEPGTPFDSKTHKVKLTKETIESNKRFFDSKDQVPNCAYSMGIATILSAKKIVLIAYGENKAEAIYRTVEAPNSEDVPGSALQLHDDVTVILDEAAASKLSK